jgi:hypothetical protein
MSQDRLNICTVTLGADALIVNENLIEFNRLYKDIKLYIVCPKKDEYLFVEALEDKNYEIITEEKFISFDDFKNIFQELSINLSYKDQFESRLQWYYALFLKFFFIHKFFENDESKLVIWEGDSVILKKIKFFHNDTSLLYVWVNYFHHIFYKTCNEVLGILPKYYGSFITMFGSLTRSEFMYLNNSLGLEKLTNKDFCRSFSRKVLSGIFKIQESYDNAMFSDYDLIGISNLNKKFKKQIPIFFLRSSLDGKLTVLQKKIAKLFGAHLVAYEHRHPNKHSKGMLTRKQSWNRFFKIIVYYYSLFKIYQIRFNFKYYFKNFF